MNRYRITALEDVDICVSRERSATALVRGVSRPVATRSAPSWTHLRQGETCEALAIHAVRGDLFEEASMSLPANLTTPIVIHEALRVEALEENKSSDNKTFLPKTDHNP